MKKILIVEDDMYIRNIYTVTFKQEGFEVDEAVNGKEAVEKLSHGSYDIVLLDIMLPEMTGIEVLKVIRKDQSSSKNTPVFLATNLGQEDIIKEAFTIGADGYFIKGQLNPHDIVNEINLFFTQQQNMASMTPQASGSGMQYAPPAVPPSQNPSKSTSMPNTGPSGTSAVSSSPPAPKDPSGV